MYPRLKVRSDDDPISLEVDQNSNSDSDRSVERTAESTVEYLSLEGHQSLKSPIKKGSNSVKRPHTSCATPPRSISKSYPVSFTSTPITTTEKQGKNNGDKVDSPNLLFRPRAVVSSRENDDLIALQNRRTEKTPPRVKKCNINPSPNRKGRNENKILRSVPVSAKKPQTQVPSTVKKKEGNGTTKMVAVIARPN
ncbi:Striated muscle preferentially expressed protein kinase [Rhynchospora pubera]|uniref:Striated muscle preferentially expressed protein kinase n=1 Tax=Rhynchospora pubera TaxID=906938 RepID=A0AAV8ASW4_9POAL|nr:Striated muscle preferentially expressed protein kinase [Rhynchospora pubera]